MTVQNKGSFQVSSADSLTVANTTGNNLTVNTNSTLTNKGTLTLTSPAQVSNAGTLNLSTTGNTVVYTGNGNGSPDTYTITSLTPTYQNLIINSTDTSDIYALGTALSVQNLTISSGTLDMNGSALSVAGTFSNNGTLRLHGNETTSSFTNDASHGTLLVNGGGTYASLAGLTSFNNLTLSGAGTWTLNYPVTVNGNLQLTKGTLSQNGQQISVGGNWSDASPAVFTSSGTVMFTGNSSITEPRGFRNLTVNTASKTVTLASPLTVSGALTLTAGTLDASSSNYGISLVGNWMNNGGTFTPRSGTVTFSGINQTIGGTADTTFYNLAKSVTAPDTLTFAHGRTITVQNATTLAGASTSAAPFASLRFEWQPVEHQPGRNESHDPVRGREG